MNSSSADNGKEPKSGRSRGEAGKVTGVCLGLLAAVWFVYAQTLRQGFVNIDDGIYIYDNHLITAGLTRAGIAWFFRHAYCDYWAPLLAISQMADCQFYGLWPGGHHLTNVLLFGTTVVALFLLLRNLTGALWRSAFVAAVWALHPLRAESVAWVTERKDTLSGLFFILTIAAYRRYTRQPRSWGRYLAFTALFAANLLCKPTVVTLPFVLLLLDYWPQRRFASTAPATWKPLLVEKIPLFLLSAALCLVTLLTGSRTLATTQQAPPAIRAGNVILSYLTYLRETFYPVGLAAFYPYPEHAEPWGKIALAVLLLAGITLAALRWRRTQPWLAVGWFWYLGMLVPMIGWVQTGEQAYADRDTYLPQIGLLLAITWSIWPGNAALSQRRWLCGSAAAAVLALLLMCARVQASYWHDSATLWRHTLACTSGNALAQNNLGVALRDENPQEAALHYQAALDIHPRYAQALYNYGNLFLHTRQTHDAIERYRQALAINPHYFDALHNLGLALAASGQTGEAAALYRRALAERPESGAAHSDYGHLLLAEGRTTEAIGQFERATESEPGQTYGYDGLGSALLVANQPVRATLAFHQALHVNTLDDDALSGLGNACALQGRLPEAAAYWREALALKPAKLTTLNNLAWALATGPVALRDGAEAVALAQRALQVSGGGSPVVLQTLSAAYAEAGRFAEARETARTALQLAKAQSNAPLAAKISRQMLQYNSDVALREAP